MGRFRLSIVGILAGAALVGSCVGAEDPVDTVAADYVKAVLALGQHDADYVDAYYGPEAWRTEVEAANLSLADVRDGAVAARAALGCLLYTSDAADE